MKSLSTDKLSKAALAFENAIRKYIPFTADGETYEFRKVLDFGTVTATCVNGDATLWVVYPDKSTTYFKLAKLGKSLLWFFRERPTVTHTTFELFRGLSLWYGATEWLESIKDKEVK